eukprot:CAMPEP_0184239872 /NCGR_PEP_ID=MMETSP0976-20121227/27603_1 /TAXON_ID=483370 /ORGANISM="non described non described, Strain CCMP2097" /LENGTH=307 /DNA_ID=CAMNT_0026545089 /DNA_START=109 /DNA_END=1032 /DNA_ORIENTATION=+
MAPYATSSPKSAESVAKSVRRPYRDGTVGGTVSVHGPYTVPYSPPRVRIRPRGLRSASGSPRVRVRTVEGPPPRQYSSTRRRRRRAACRRRSRRRGGRLWSDRTFGNISTFSPVSSAVAASARRRAVAAEPRQRALRDGHLPEALEGVSAPLDAPPNRPRDLDALVRRAVKGRAVRNVPVVRSVPVVRVAVKGAGVAVEHLENIVEDVRALVHRSHRASVAVCRVGGDGGPERASAAVVVYQARRPRGEVHEQVVVELLQDAIKVVGLAMARLYSDKARVDASEPEGLERLDAVGEVDKVARSTLCV